MIFWPSRAALTRRVGSRNFKLLVLGLWGPRGARTLRRMVYMYVGTISELHVSLGPCLGAFVVLV